jgi:hypothetical protein
VVPKNTPAPHVVAFDDRADEQRAPQPSPFGLSALEAIQDEVRVAAERGEALPAARVRAAHPRLEAICLVLPPLAGLAVLLGIVGLLMGLRAAFLMEATAARTSAIFLSIGEFGAGLVAGLLIFTLHELIRVVLDIERNTRPRS